LTTIIFEKNCSQIYVLPKRPSIAANGQQPLETYRQKKPVHKDRGVEYVETYFSEPGPAQPPIQWVRGGFFPGGKAAGAWSWPLTSI